MSEAPSAATAQPDGGHPFPSLRSELLMLVLITTVALARVIATYPIFVQVYDEPAHIAGGLEWLEMHTFTSFVQNPPLPRILFALGPWLEGGHYEAGHPITSGNAILYRADYTRTLSLARLGNLPFLALAIVAVWFVTRRIFDRLSGLVAAALFSLLPPILGNAGLATTDMAGAATVGLTIVALLLWIDRPSPVRSAGLGAAIGIAMVSKFSAIFFVPLAILPFIVCSLYRSGRESPLRQTKAMQLFIAAVLLVVSCVTVIWATYRFSWAPASRALEIIVANSPMTPIFSVWQRTGLPIPAPELIAGISVLQEINRVQFYPSYFLGEVSNSGFAMFYPVVLAVKTPIAFLVLSLLGGAWYTSRPRRYHWAAAAIGPAALLMLVFSMTFRINTGIRHCLPMYLLMAIVAGAAAVDLWRHATNWSRVASAGLALSLLVASVAAHPDYVSNFNLLAGDHPERIAITADLDWGQDLLRVEDSIARNRIDKLWLAYFGTALPYMYDFGVTVEPLPKGVRPSGWIAVSETLLHPIWKDDYVWLKEYEPVERIGRSMWLYRIP